MKNKYVVCIESTSIKSRS